MLEYIKTPIMAWRLLFAAGDKDANDYLEARALRFNVLWAVGYVLAQMPDDAARLLMHNEDYLWVQ